MMAQVIKKNIHSVCILSYLSTRKFLMDNANALLFFGGVILLYGGLQEVVHADSGGYQEACGRVLGLVEGSFGALITAAAGIGAIVASAVGGFKMAWSLIVVAVGAFILRSYITLFNGPCTTVTVVG